MAWKRAATGLFPDAKIHARLVSVRGRDGMDTGIFESGGCAEELAMMTHHESPPYPRVSPGFDRQPDAVNGGHSTACPSRTGRGQMPSSLFKIRWIEPHIGLSAYRDRDGRAVQPSQSAAQAQCSGAGWADRADGTCSMPADGTA
jgi:hypothetical protein